MADKLWSEDWSVLAKRPFEVVYTGQDATRRTNAVIRFGLAWAVLVMLVKRRFSLVVLVLLAVLMVTMRGKGREHVFVSGDREAHRRLCQPPSHDNPLANPTYTDWSSGGGKLPACVSSSVSSEIDAVMGGQELSGPAIVGEDLNSRAASRAFYSVPVSGNPDGREAFVHSLFGSNIGRSQQ